VRLERWEGGKKWLGGAGQEMLRSGGEWLQGEGGNSGRMLPERKTAWRSKRVARVRPCGVWVWGVRVWGGGWWWGALRGGAALPQPHGSEVSLNLGSVRQNQAGRMGGRQWGWEAACPVCTRAGRHARRQCGVWQVGNSHSMGYVGACVCMNGKMIQVRKNSVSQPMPHVLDTMRKYVPQNAMSQHAR